MTRPTSFTYEHYGTSAMFWCTAISNPNATIQRITDGDQIECQNIGLYRQNNCTRFGVLTKSQLVKCVATDHNGIDHPYSGGAIDIEIIPSGMINHIFFIFLNY